MDELRRIMVEGNVGRVPVVTDEAYEQTLATGSARVGDVIGIATRTDVLAAYQGRWERGSVELAEPQVYTLQALADHPFFGRLFRACSALSEDFAGVYLVGGFVRDLLLDQPNADSTSPSRATASSSPNAWLRSWAAGCGRTASSRPRSCCFRPRPWGGSGRAQGGKRALPCGRRHDSHRVLRLSGGASRGSSTPPSARISSGAISPINAMAISLRGDDFGSVLDFFGGMRDLREGTIRVLHNLSFIEDPTRIFRAVRYENRYRFPHGRADQSPGEELRGHASGRRSVQCSPARRAHPACSASRASSGLSSGCSSWAWPARCIPSWRRGRRRSRWWLRSIRWWRTWRLEGEVMTWRLRLAAVTRNMDHDELYMWLEKLKLKRADADVIRTDVVMGPLLARPAVQ